MPRILLGNVHLFEKIMRHLTLRARTCIQLQAGSLACTAENMPAFLYPSQQPYDSTDCLQKLLQGPLCVRVYKHIFLGRACALGQAGTTRRKNQAQLIGLERTMPRTIAYAAVQVSNTIMHYCAVAPCSR